MTSAIFYAYNIIHIARDVQHCLLFLSYVDLKKKMMKFQS